MQQPHDFGQTPAARRRIVVAVIVGGLLHEILLNYLFPTVWFGFIVFPILFLYTVVAGSVAYGVLRIPRLGVFTQPMKILLIALTVVALAWAQIASHPSYNSPSKQISQYWATFRQYPANTAWEDIFSGNHIQRMAAVVKFRSSLPDDMLVARLVASKRYYIVEYRKGVPSYDHSRLDIIDAGDTWIFVTDPNEPYYRLESRFMKHDVEAILDGKLSMASGYVFLSSIDEIRGRDLTGADRLFMQALKWFR